MNLPLANEPLPERTCGQCVHYLPHRSGKTKRVLPSHPGACGWPLPDSWPMSYLKTAWNGAIVLRDRPMPDPVCAGTLASSCRCFHEMI